MNGLIKKLRREINMLGAIVGDIVGSIYEFNNIRRKNFDCLTLIAILLMIA